MKKFFCVFFAALLIYSAAFAEFNLGSVETEELKILYTKVLFELMSRKDVSMEIAPGVYVVGADIPAGKYHFKTSSYMASFDIYKSEEAAIDSDYLKLRAAYMMSSVTGSEQVNNITLRDGEAISISGGSLIITRLD